MRRRQRLELDEAALDRHIPDRSANAA
jgi:hypothetical protein